ncbi:hypothetical protein GCM10011613_07910 [Cellvibrio zantedeschiae]|uniref:DUF4124 domain-containing protein n=1 Tax=Cellvibrio zantedeschiae TaxID=1237077 RepID=A0ABQ3ATL8_9GAMM|nr:CvpA family protein [Cellvibrio zantedeschiae]GGY66395.1 hypothetical protein GCM10011613_07910 [Cellvibrio zantedeschiae]
MSITTIVFLVILAFFTWRGYQKGFVGAITKVMSFIIAYPAAIFFTKPFANILRAFTGLDGLILFLVAGCTIFLVASLLVTLLLNSLARLVPDNKFTETGSKIGGTAFGIIFGSVIGLVAVYLIDISKPHTQTFANANAEAPSEKSVSDAEAESIKKYVVAEDAPTKSIKDTLIDITAKKLVSTAASTAVSVITSDKATTQLTKTLTQDPQAMLNHVQNMTNNGDFRELMNNPEFQAELNKGDTASLMKNNDFRALMQNPDMQAIIASEDGNDADSQQAAAEKMIQAWQKVETLKNDPRVLNIVSDEAFQAQLNSPNKLPLLMNPKMRELSEIIFSSDSNPAPLERPTKNLPPPTPVANTHYVVEDITDGVKQTSTTNSEDPAEGNTDKAPEQKLYRWTDADGKVHFSDKPIKN